MKIVTTLAPNSKYGLSTYKESVVAENVHSAYADFIFDAMIRQYRNSCGLPIETFMLVDDSYMLRTFVYTKDGWQDERYRQ